MEEDGKPQPMAGFRVGTVTPTTRHDPKKSTERKSKRTSYQEQKEMEKVESSTHLRPMAMAGMDIDNNNMRFTVVEEDPEKQYVYFPAEVEFDSLVDWKIEAKLKGSIKEKNNNKISNNNNNNNNNETEQKKGALVKVNNTEVALFKYGDDLLGM